MADKPEIIKFMDKDAQVIRRSDGSEKIVVKTADANEIYAGLGVTAEVRNTIREADDKIVGAALKLQSERMLANNKGKKENDAGWMPRSELVFGSGNGAIETEVTAHRAHTGKDIKTGEPYTSHKYGTIRVTKVYKACAELRKEGGLFDQIAKDFEKACAKKGK